MSIEEETPSLPPKFSNNKRHTASGDVHNNSMESVFKTIDMESSPPVRHATSSPLIPTIGSPQSPSDSSSKGSREELDLMDALDDIQSYAAAGSADSIASENIYDSITDEEKKAALEQPPPLPEPRARNSATENSLPPPLPRPRPRGSSVLNRSINNGGSSMDEPEGGGNGTPPPLPQPRPRGSSLLNRSINNGGSSVDEPDGGEDGAPPPLPKKSSRRGNAQE